MIQAKNQYITASLLTNVIEITYIASYLHQDYSTTVIGYGNYYQSEKHI